jgi:hypothetical protein
MSAVVAVSSRRVYASSEFDPSRDKILIHAPITDMWGLHVRKHIWFMCQKKYTWAFLQKITVPHVSS